jgi:hypothetical protein
LNLVAYAVDGGGDRVAFLLLEPLGEPEDSLAGLLRGLDAGRKLLPAASPEEIVGALGEIAPGCAISAARWEAETIAVAAKRGPVPFVLREGEKSAPGADGSAQTAARPGDVLVVCSSGLARLRPLEASGSIPVESSLERFGRLALGQPLTAAFARLVADWKREGISIGERDVLALTARRIGGA